MEADDVLILYSHHHLLSAIHLAHLCADLEERPMDELIKAFREDHPYPKDAIRAHAASHPAGPKNRLRAYATGAIFSSVAAVEARINELYFDAKDKRPDLTNETVTALLMIKKFLGDYQQKTRSTLEKYQLALLVTHNRPFDRAARPYQDVDLLLKLRNALIHFYPRWGREQVEGEAYKSIVDGLQSRGLRENPFTDKDYPFFPEKCLGYDCARWAVRTSYSFIKVFLARMRLTRLEKSWEFHSNRIEELADLHCWRT